MAYPRAAAVRVPLTHRPSVPPPDKYPPEVLRPLVCQARRNRGHALFTRVPRRRILRSSPVLLFVSLVEQSLCCLGLQALCLSSVARLGGQGVCHQLRQSAAEFVEATLSNYPCPLTLGGEAHVAYHLSEIPSALREAYDPSASVRRIGGALKVAPLLKIAQQVVDRLPAQLVTRRKLGWS